MKTMKTMKTQLQTLVHRLTVQATYALLVVPVLATAQVKTGTAPTFVVPEGASADDPASIISNSVATGSIWGGNTLAAVLAMVGIAVPARTFMNMSQGKADATPTMLAAHSLIGATLIGTGGYIAGRVAGIWA